MTHAQHATALGAARELVTRGWVPVAIPPREKGPAYTGWQTSRLTDDAAQITYDGDSGPVTTTVEQLFGRPGGNVGIVLGDPSGGLVDIDIDDPSGHALRLAPRFLPATATFGRASKPASHWLYLCGVPAGARRSLNAPIAPLYEAFRTDPKKVSVTLVEVRGTGVQTMAPGSVHPCGEPVRWDRNVAPTAIPRAELDLLCARLAMAAVLVQAGADDDDAVARTLTASPAELLALAPEPTARTVAGWPGLGSAVPPAPPKPPRADSSSRAFEDAKRRYLDERTPAWPDRVVPCQVCGSTASFKAHGHLPQRWICYSTNHPDDCGRQNLTGDAHFGDVLDLDSYAAGVDPKAHLIAEGYLEAYVDRLSDPALLEIAEGALLARQDWERVAAQRAAERKTKGPDVTAAKRERSFSGSAEVRFESDSDVTLAIGLCEELEAGLAAPVVGCDGTLWRYEVPRWRPMEAHELENHVAGWEGAPVLGWKGEPVPMRLSNAKIKSVVERSKVARAKPGFFRHTVGAVAFKNGMATLRDGQVVLEAPSPDHRVRHVLELDYTEADPVHLFDFLASCFDGAEDAVERGLYLSEFIGCCLAGVATRFEMASILLGHGANGKSTWLTYAVRPIFPSSSITNVSPQDMGKEYNRATLVGSAINIVSEMPDGEILGAEAVKAIISGEPIQARVIREAPFNLECRAGHVFAANDLPALRDFSAGFRRRWQIINWPNSFEVGDPRRRSDWPELLTSELGAIASWYVRCAAQAVHRKRYTAVPSSENEVNRWVNESDSVAVWVESRCKRSTATTQSAKLYSDYRNWVGSVGMRAVTIQKFGRRLTRLGISSVHLRDGEQRGLLIQHDAA